MEFDKTKAFSAINAKDVKIGSIGYVANTLEHLKDIVESEDLAYRVTVTNILTENTKNRFALQNGYSYPLFYLLEEPKETEGECRPYKDIKELIDAYCGEFGVYKSSSRFPQIWVKDVNTGIVRMIIEYSTFDNTVQTGHYWCNMKELLKNYTYLDGSKCGIKEEYKQERLR